MLTRSALSGLLLALVLAGCSTGTSAPASMRDAASADDPGVSGGASPGPTAGPRGRAPEALPTPIGGSDPSGPSGDPTGDPDAGSTAPADLPASDGRPLRAVLSVPAIGLRGLPVVPYRGTPDDAPGTEIQDGGVAASPHGPRAGIGPGGVGNYIVTAHRTSSTRAFEDLPSLRAGAPVHVRTGRTTYTYRVTTTRETSFRSARSLARQSAAVPGHPGRRPTRAMITLSTCATPEDHARGNFWADELGNPEHRIDKIGVLVAVRSRR